MGIFCSRCLGTEVDINAEVELSHFTLMRSVGKGSFGKVRIVQHKKTKNQFALKYINKSKIIEMKAVNNTIQERRLLENLHNQFLCNLRYAFQDDENLFMVLDLMLGGDLRFHLQERKRFSDKAVQFFIAEITCALEYLHSNRVIHRDIKPDNVLLDHLGHVHLTDFNVAVKLKKSSILSATAGSLAYIAPEILNRKGYCFSVDWWSLGIVMYELLNGKRPFKGKDNDELKLEIMQTNIDFNVLRSHNISKDSIDCVSKLLERDINKRLGTFESGGTKNLKEHAFFNNLDWNELIDKKIAPPFKPDSTKFNFDATHELEDIFLEENPLRIKRRKKSLQGKTNLNPVEKEMFKLETKYTIYDYSKLTVDEVAKKNNFLSINQDSKTPSQPESFYNDVMGEQNVNPPNTPKKSQLSQSNHYESASINAKDVPLSSLISEIVNESEEESVPQNITNSIPKKTTETNQSNIEIITFNRVATSPTVTKIDAKTILLNAGFEDDQEEFQAGNKI